MRSGSGARLPGAQALDLELPGLDLTAQRRGAQAQRHHRQRADRDRDQDADREGSDHDQRQRVTPCRAGN